LQTAATDEYSVHEHHVVKSTGWLGSSVHVVSGSVFWFFRDKTGWALLQLIGAGCLLVVVLAHVAEALELFPSM